MPASVKDLAWSTPASGSVKDKVGDVSDRAKDALKRD